MIGFTYHFRCLVSSSLASKGATISLSTDNPLFDAFMAQALAEGHTGPVPRHRFRYTRTKVAAVPATVKAAPTLDILPLLKIQKKSALIRRMRALDLYELGDESRGVSIADLKKRLKTLGGQHAE